MIFPAEVWKDRFLVFMVLFVIRMLQETDLGASCGSVCTLPVGKMQMLLLIQMEQAMRIFLTVIIYAVDDWGPNTYYEQHYKLQALANTAIQTIDSLNLTDPENQRRKS